MRSALRSPVAGPVWIDIPKDVQTAEIEIDVLPEPGERAPAPEFSAERARCRGHDQRR